MLRSLIKYNKLIPRTRLCSYRITTPLNHNNKNFSKSVIPIRNFSNFKQNSPDFYIEFLKIFPTINMIWCPIFLIASDFNLTYSLAHSIFWSTGPSFLLTLYKCNEYKL